jgi:hypothetical protein
MPPYWAGFAEFMYRSYGDPRTPKGRALLAERSPIHKVDRIKKLIADETEKWARVRASRAAQITPERT